METHTFCNCTFLEFRKRKIVETQPERETEKEVKTKRH